MSLGMIVVVYRTVQDYRSESVKESFFLQYQNRSRLESVSSGQPANMGDALFNAGCDVPHFPHFLCLVTNDSTDNIIEPLLFKRILCRLQC